MLFSKSNTGEHCFLCHSSLGTYPSRKDLMNLRAMQAMVWFFSFLNHSPAKAHEATWGEMMLDYVNVICCSCGYGVMWCFCSILESLVAYKIVC
mmetsp:Transcript_41341/g.86779  ORF Transcript_41341/g.86779 Transcript_41341/m.86779 type:complete len:94 (+) Transcript_41341:35-316(+)